MSDEKSSFPAQFNTGWINFSNGSLFGQPSSGYVPVTPIVSGELLLLDGSNFLLLDGTDFNLL